VTAADLSRAKTTKYQNISIIVVVVVIIIIIINVMPYPTFLAQGVFGVIKSFRAPL